MLVQSFSIGGLADSDLDILLKPYFRSHFLQVGGGRVGDGHFSIIVPADYDIRLDLRSSSGPHLQTLASALAPRSSTPIELSSIPWAYQEDGSRRLYFTVVRWRPQQGVRVKHRAEHGIESDGIAVQLCEVLKQQSNNQPGDNAILLCQSYGR